MGVGKNTVAEGDDEEEGAPEWMVTFSDCMTLLLTFFVLLLSFSSFSDISAYKELTVIFAKKFPSINPDAENRSAVLDHIIEIRALKKEVEQGSEIRQPQIGEGKEGGQKYTNQPDSHENTIFFAPSQKLFWGEGVVLSAYGRKVLSDMAMFLKEVRNRVVISECDMNSLSPDEVGLQRAWSVMRYLRQSGIKMDRLCMSSASMMMGEGDTPTAQTRYLQVVLLERNLYR